MLPTPPVINHKRVRTCEMSDSRGLSGDIERLIRRDALTWEGVTDSPGKEYRRGISASCRPIRETCAVGITITPGLSDHRISQGQSCLHLRGTRESSLDAAPHARFTKARSCIGGVCNGTRQEQILSVVVNTRWVGQKAYGI